MNPVLRKVLTLGGLLLALVVVVRIATAPRHPVAIIRVVDSAGKPIAGAVITPEGLRTKAGPYVAGWYSWRQEYNGVPNPPVTSGKDGFVRIPYPKFVFERIETGTLCLSANHPEYVPDRPERVVATAPPTGTPLVKWAQYIWDCIRHKAIVAHPDPVVLLKGAILKISVAHTGSGASSASNSSHLFAQISGSAPEDTNFWLHPEPGVILTRRLAAGSHTVRAIQIISQISSNNVVSFSDVVAITASIGLTNDLHLDLAPGVTVSGTLDDSVPRPVKHGRVIANVWPIGAKPQEYPPQWHGWSQVADDGSFSIPSLPSGDLEIVALCDGFVSTNGPGQFHMRYPQKHLLAANDISIVIGMEPTARLEVKVTDNNDQPLKDVHVSTWPNVRYGEWSATILANDCYNTSDLFTQKPDKSYNAWKEVPDFEGVSDSNGLAILPNVPADVTELAAASPTFVLPAVANSMGGKNRQATISLIAAQTNHFSIQLEPRDKSPIRHY